MRHNKSFKHLGRTKAHRKAMLSNMATSLILHKRISTTVAKAKALKVFVEPIITKAKEDTTHSRRLVFKELQNKEGVKELFGVVRQKVGDRPGGYTRILKTGYRLGDNAHMCIIELVDFNDIWLEGKAKQETATATKKTRRSRRGKGTAKASSQQVDTKVAESIPAQEDAKSDDAPEAEKSEE